MIDIEISPELRRRFKRQLRFAGHREIGGILMSEQIAPNRFRLLDFSVDQKTGTRNGFRRNEVEHMEALDRFLARHGNNFARYNYLGEWHSHPSFSVEPSVRDCQTMFELTSRDETVLFAALLIVRLDYWFFLRCSAMMFVRGQRPRPISIVSQIEPEKTETDNV